MKQEGFSIIEFMIAIAIITVVIGAAFQAHLTMSKSNITETAKIEGQFESAIELQILENDIKNAGFCVPTVCTVASKNNLSSSEAEDWEGFTGAETGGDFSHIIGTDRLYLSDLVEIVDDFSSDETESGVLTDADYTTMVNAKLNNDGYFATLSVDEVAGSTSITINTGERDIDGNDGQPEPSPYNDDYDFKADKALIITDTAGNPPEGRRIDGSHASDSTTIDFMRSEALENGFLASDSLVVPAICYHLEKPGASSPYSGQPQVFTLARNSDPFLEGVEDFQVVYHYCDDDDDEDGGWEHISAEWIDDMQAGYNPDNLHSIRIFVVVRMPKRQENEVDTRANIPMEIIHPDDGSVIRTVRTLTLTTEMKHYYRRELTIDVVPRNKR